MISLCLSTLRYRTLMSISLCVLDSSCFMAGACGGADLSFIFTDQEMVIQLTYLQRCHEKNSKLNDSNSI